MAYRDLSIKERHAIIRAGVANGAHSLADIEARYDAFTDKSKHPDYDMEAYVRENPSAVFTHPENVHFIDKYKLPNHPTFSDESVYATQQTPAGHWDTQAKTFEPSTYMVDTYGSTPTIERLRRDDPDYTAVYKGGVLLPDVEVRPYAEGGSIHIKPSRKGTFTAAATKHGKSVQAFASQVLAHKENYSPAMVKKAVFAHNSKSWKHSTGGPLYPFSFSKPIPSVRYDEGGRKKVIPSKAQIVQAAWANENPTNRGLQNNGLWVQYDDPKGDGLKNVGPGLLVGATIPNKKEYTKQELDNAAYAFGLEGLASIGQAYNDKYGTKAFPTPFDTVSVAPKLLMLDTRYQNGRLPIGSWPALYQAIADGNWAEAIKQSRSTYVTDDGVKHYDNDRVRRRAESLFPNMFEVSFINDSPIYPVVKPL